MSKFILSALLIGLPLLAATSHAGMRCGNDLVLEGENFEQVRNTCGEADAEYDMGNRIIYREVFQGQE